MYRIFLFLFSCFIYSSQLDYLIPPEVKNDEFYFDIYNLSKSENLKSILEIGASSGEGSTEAFARGISENPCKPTLYTIEVSKVRYLSLKKRYENNPFIKCYNLSSVGVDDFPSKRSMIEYLLNHELELPDVNLVLRWLKQDINYLYSSKVPQNGIEKIKKENKIDCFDAVLIDGSEFTGEAELKLVYGAKFILLDDIKTYKNHENHQQLKNDANYKLLKENYLVRNGYSIFKKI